ncbi:MAG: TetR/AcrR family transcriptional regulator [Alphaproteobacteria bacterium]
MKARLLEAAAEVFGEQGFTAARVSDIVAHAGVAQGTFYLYFKNKKAIFLDLVDSFFDRLLTETIGRFPVEAITGPEDAVRQIRAIWRIVLADCRAQRDLVALVLHEAGALGPAYRDHIARHYQHTAESMATYVREAAGRGILRATAPELTAWAVIGMVERAIHYAVFVAPEADIDELAADLTRIELGGLLADPVSLD